MKKNVDKLGNFYIQRNLDVAQDLQSAGIEMEKLWSAVHADDVCELCTLNEKAGWIPINQPFPSGHQRPLAHSGCRCDLMERRKNS